MQPLPDNSYPTGSPAHQAYATCKLLENSFPLLNQNFGPSTSVCARLLGYLIIHAPTPGGHINITNEINSCNEDGEKLHILAQFYINHFLRVFKQDKGHTPYHSSHVSRPSFDVMQERVKQLLVEPPKSYRDAKAAALVRDGYRCIVTGFVDSTTIEEYPELSELAMFAIRGTNCAHILAWSTSRDINNTKGPKHDYAASAWAVMERMGGVSVIKELNGDNIHRLQNVMTLDTSIHHMFDHLYLWFEATNVPNQYTLCSGRAGYLVGLPRTITLTSQNGAPLPDPRYLALHAACAKVAHLSGAGQYIDSVDRDIDTTRVLARDGSSARTLIEAMTRIAIAA